MIPRDPAGVVGMQCVSSGESVANYPLPNFIRRREGFRKNEVSVGRRRAAFVANSLEIENAPRAFERLRSRRSMSQA